MVPANARYRLLLLLAIVCCCSTQVSGADCKVQLCSRQYARAVDEDRIAQGPNYRYCQLLHAYAECVRATARSCRGDLSYHSVQSLVGQWTRMYDCGKVLEKGPGHNSGTQGGGHRFQKPPRQHQECNGYRPAGSFSHCALFGDPHLRTFYDELQTCSVPGAWPLLDNPHVAVQVTNDPVGKGSQATAITKITVIIRQHGPCAQEKTYEAQPDSLPGVFADGSKWSGPGVRIREEVPGKHIEIHLRYVATRIVIRQSGKYLTFAAKMPSAIATQGAQGDATLELCVRGCPRRERIDFERILDSKSGPKNEAIAACKALNITDFYFDACVFDLLTTGDDSFSAAARDAMIDGGQSLVNGSFSAVPRGLESGGSERATNSVLVLIVGLLMLLMRCHVFR
ncbi:hypothetical protein JTE90_028008 [Oedothorax gibbosus]|uniref:Repulsive guidance molecule A n=1 Tax=Oedothorax gibbosus TaxID=931172 RepID=A0AAV6VFA7_9ARAC|nr:hypothetical protein JTE90_028008 [Oedothorax gibbosus]